VYYAPVEVVDLLLSQGADPAYGNLLHWAIIRKQNTLDMARRILVTGISINMMADYIACMPFGKGTPLHLAVWEGKIDVVRLLLNAGADISCLDSNQLTPRALAEKEGYQDIAGLL